MDPLSSQVTEILLNCESNGLAPPYVVSEETYHVQKRSLFARSFPVITRPVEFKSKDEEIFVISDLHIAAGKNSAGIYRGTENFFADEGFSRFLKYADSSNSKHKILVLNGDVFDFIRIVDYPGRVRKARLSKRIKQYLKLDPIKTPDPAYSASAEDEFIEWNDVLKKIGISKSIDELKIISKKEIRYGLKSHDYKTVWKLHLIQKGHEIFFDALAEWLKKGNKLIILKGNHDVEWYWPAVRNYFRLILAERIAGAEVNNTPKVLKEILPNITFIDDSILIDKDLYIEHGHRYDKYTMILEKPLINANELNIPFGSFFNRYLLNRVELFLPYLDNVRPSGNILPVLMRENFPLALKVLLQHVPFTVRMLFTFDGRYIFYMFKRVFLFILVLVLPVIILLVINSYYLKNLSFIYPAWSLLKDIYDVITPSFLREPIINILKGFGSLFLSYILARFASWMQLTEPDSLEYFARERCKNTDYKYLTMGHTHNPGQYRFRGGKRFYNTGTWIPVIENSNAEIREDKTYSFLHMERDAEGKPVPANSGLLQRWNDNALRAETQILVQRK